MVRQLNLPSFLAPFGEPTDSPPHQAVFDHPILGPAHSLWWNSSIQHAPEAVFFFIPGNPGLVEFYTQFLNSLHSKHSGLAIIAHAHLAHTPAVQAGPLNGDNGLTAQIQSAIQALDAILDTFNETKIIISGHSVGAWIALQVLKARPSGVYRAFMLCPTLSHIVDTPNGRRLNWLFSSPFPMIISYLSYLTRPLPLSLLFRNWPRPQIAVLRSLLNSPASIFACLSMAHEEMVTIRELDTALLDEHKHRIYLYFAHEDGWVSTHKATVMCSFIVNDAARVVQEADVSHAFCINHSEEVARQCSSWLTALGL